jgi:gluconokinase
MPFVEGDDLHPKANVEKMSGQPLNDADREPWLELIMKEHSHPEGWGTTATPHGGCVR